MKITKSTTVATKFLMIAGLPTILLTIASAFVMFLSIIMRMTLFTSFIMIKHIIMLTTIIPGIASANTPAKNNSKKV